MFDRDYHRFHSARAAAESMAADKATSEPVRALHRRLAEMHAERARVFGAELSDEVMSMPQRRPMFFGSGPVVSEPRVAMSA